MYQYTYFLLGTGDEKNKNDLTDRIQARPIRDRQYIEDNLEKRSIIDGVGRQLRITKYTL